MIDDRMFHLNRAEQEIARAERAPSGLKRRLHVELARLHIDAVARTDRNRQGVVEI